MENNRDSLDQAALDKRSVLPLVSIVITSFNRETFIEDAIKSALAQDYPNLEVVISDNASTDNTDEIVKKYLPDPRIKYSINDINIGMNANFLKATKELATGEYITYVSSDDYLVNDSFVSEALARIVDYPSVSLVHSINIAEITSSQEFFIDESYFYYMDNFYKQPFIAGLEVFRSFPKCHSISFGGTMFNREKLMSCNPFQGKIFSGDTQVILQLLLMGDAAFIDKKTYLARRHDGSHTYSISHAQTYIDNLDYIDLPYRFALEWGFLERDEAASWKQQMYVCCFSQCLMSLYKSNRGEYSVLTDFLREKEPTVLTLVTTTPRWRLNSTLFANKWVGECYMGFRRAARKVKNFLSGDSDGRSLIDPGR